MGRLYRSVEERLQAEEEAAAKARPPSTDMEIADFIANRARAHGRIRHEPSLGQKSCWQVLLPVRLHDGSTKNAWHSLPKAELWTSHIYPLLEGTPDSEAWEALRIRLQRWAFASRIMQLMAPKLRDL